ncbi:MAG: hypothetical protein AAF821_21650 [Cyanobacteria bacterium P01_D01_bin.156]
MPKFAPKLYTFEIVLTRHFATMKILQMVICNELMLKISQVIMLAERPLTEPLANQLHQVMYF